MPYMPAYISPRETLAAVRVPLAKSRSGTIGSSAPVSIRTNRPSRKAPTASDPRVSGLDHPSVPASTSPSTMPAMPNVEVNAPAMSKCPRRRSVSSRTMRPTSRTTIPIGTLTNMTQRHDTSWVSAPPATRPMAPPAADTVVKRPIARTRSRPSEKMVVSSASDEGAANAAPAPCRARAARSIQPETANPPNSELTVKRAMPARKVRRRPRRSPERAPSSSRPPKVSR